MNLFRTKDINLMLQDAQKKKLKRELTAWDLTLLGIGAVIGTGIFVLTGTGALTAGPALAVSFVIAGIACALAALCYAEFASLVPISGSVYTYSYATMGEFSHLSLVGTWHSNICLQSVPFRLVGQGISNPF